MLKKYIKGLIAILKKRIAKGIVKIILVAQDDPQVRPLLGELYSKSRDYAHINNVKIARNKYDIHPSVVWGLDTKIYGDGQISIGENTYLGRHCFILSNTPETRLVIGKHCSISHNVHIRTEIHKQMFHWSDERYSSPIGANIIIGDYVWIGANVFIKGGVTIGDNSIIGANSVVTSNIPPNTIYGGIPARFIRDKSVYLKSQYISDEFNADLEHSEGTK